LRIPVVLYAVALLAMAAQAASRATSRRDAAAILAAVGAALFVVSDSVLAFQRFRHPLACGHVMVLGTYFAAQGGIALSVVLHRDRAT
jgi:alkylglycerol monooxygenase